MNKYWMPTLFLISIIASFLYKKYITKRYLFLLMKHKKNQEEKEYMDLLVSLPMKLYFSSITLMVLKIKYYVDTNEFRHVKEISEQWMASNEKNKGLTQILLPVYAYYVNYGYKNDALNVYNFLMNRIDEEEDGKLYAELNDLKAIYIDHDKKYISILEEKIKKARSTSEMAVLNFRLAKLYEFIGEIGEARKLIRKLKDLGISEEETKVLDSLLQK